VSRPRKVYLFDIDGTLTPHRLPIVSEFLEFFSEWGAKNKFYLTTGSDLEKVREQLPTGVLDAAAGIFCCMGNQLLEDGGRKVIYENEFVPTPELLSSLENALADSKYSLRAGNHIEHRVGMLNFSIVGRDADLEARADYERYDGECRERIQLKARLMDEHPDLDVVVGGKISLDIFPRGNDKGQSVRHILQREPTRYIIFVGDRAMPGGNDYAARVAIERAPRGVWFNVSNWKETRAILRPPSLVTNEDAM